MKKQKQNKTVPVTDEVEQELQLHYRIMKGILCQEEYNDFSFQDYVSIILGIGTNVLTDNNNYVGFITHFANQQNYTDERKLKIVDTLHEYMKGLKEVDDKMRAYKEDNE